MTDICPIQKPGLSVIVPALNEEAVIESVFLSILEQTRARFDSDFEILLINDGSTDRTGEIMDRVAAGENRVRVLHNRPNIGLGPSYMRGVNEARHEYVMMLCGDGGLPAESLPPIFEAMGKADIVIPYILNLRQIKSKSRYLLSTTYTGIFNRLFGLKLRYYNGLPVHRLDLVRQAPVRALGFGFQAAFLVYLLKAGHSYVEVGVDGRPNTRNSTAVSAKNIWSFFLTVYDLLRVAHGAQNPQIGQTTERLDEQPIPENNPSAQTRGL